jgi:hypothetical protein
MLILFMFFWMAASSAAMTTQVSQGTAIFDKLLCGSSNAGQFCFEMSWPGLTRPSN